MFELVYDIESILKEVLIFFGSWTYFIIFVIIFLETGIILAPFLPGDSLVLAAGAFSASGMLNHGLILILLIFASISGDNINYWIGRRIGERLLQSGFRFIKKDYLQRTQLYFERYGNRTVVLARFIPFIRALAPFTAGIIRMPYPRFLLYNGAGAVLWVFIYFQAGVFAWKIPVLKEYFIYFILLLATVSLLPTAVEYLLVAHKKKNCDGCSVIVRPGPGSENT